MRARLIPMVLGAGMLVAPRDAVAAVAVSGPAALQSVHPMARSVTLAPLLDRTGLPEVEIWARQTQDLLAPDTLPLRTIGPGDALDLVQAARMIEWPGRWQATVIAPGQTEFVGLVRELGTATGTDQVLVQELTGLTRVPNPETGALTDLDVSYRQTLLEARTGTLVWQGTSSFALPAGSEQAEPAVRQALLETMKASLADCPWRTLL
ncbi:MAG: hypothetical protein VKO21_10255 [Candidatus Sericytochromatia bacterium]|nr:hypothetical protein [Candidatus Sericytochromatia bacterium]